MKKIYTGLTDEEVNKRIDENLVNYDTTIPTKTIKHILYENFFTLFNLLNLVLGIAIFSVGSYKNAIFLLIVLINTFISTYQEIHAKKIVDKLSILSSKKAVVIRNGEKSEVSINEIVLDDVLELNFGNQISTDCIILDGTIEVDESLITGESNSIQKNADEIILSGSYVVSGKCLAKVIHIGEENYTAKISSGAKYVKKVNSEIMSSLNKIIRFLSFAIVPIGIFMLFNQLKIDDNSYQEAVVKTVASIIGMIPEGLILLTTSVLAISVTRLARANVLVQELYCIETLARVDTLCLDKTGTLTEGSMEVKDIIPFKGDRKYMENILSNIGAFSEDNNSTIEAIRIKFSKPKDVFILKSVVAFSSKLKWSGMCFENIGSYVLGAPEYVLYNSSSEFKEECKKYSEDYRVLVLAHSDFGFCDKSLPNNLKPVGLILISDVIRKEAKNTLKYFRNQGVDIKIISGDNPITVSKIAKQVGLVGYEKYVDMTSIEKEEDIQNVASRYSIFGRVSPVQKKILITSLQNLGKTVAMVGDGVNDVLALKASDCSISVKSGTDASKSVSELILLDSNFASLPKIVAEGRKTINNIQRSSTLFLVKTLYSCFLALLFLFIGEVYPFMPIQLSLISVVTIGIPSFILALEPNKERIKGNFLKNVISRALPTAITVIINIIAITILNKYELISEIYHSSLCVISTGLCGICLLFTLAKSRKSEGSKFPFSIFRLVLWVLMLSLFIIGLTCFKDLFGIVPLTPILGLIIRLGIITVLNFAVLNLLFKRVLKV